MTPMWRVTRWRARARRGWVMGIGDWGLGYGDSLGALIPNPQHLIPNPHLQRHEQHAPAFGLGDAAGHAAIAGGGLRVDVSVVEPSAAIAVRRQRMNRHASEIVAAFIAREFEGAVRRVGDHAAAP